MAGDHSVTNSLLIDDHQYDKFQIAFLPTRYVGFSALVIYILSGIRKALEENYRLQWAQLREEFLQNEGRALVAQDPHYAVEMARCWRKAALSCLKLGNIREAQDYLCRALHWRCSPHAALLLAVSYLKSVTASCCRLLFVSRRESFNSH